MSQVSPYLRRYSQGYSHWCPGCQEMHILPDSWTFNGDLNKPTFTPSFKHSGIQREMLEGKWTGNWVKDETGNGYKRWCCHYILTNGVLNYCNDCTHALNGQEVPLPELPSDC